MPRWWFGERTCPRTAQVPCFRPRFRSAWGLLLRLPGGVVVLGGRRLWFGVLFLWGVCFPGLPACVAWARCGVVVAGTTRGQVPGVISARRADASAVGQTEESGEPRRARRRTFPRQGDTVGPHSGMNPLDCPQQDLPVNS